MIAVPLQTVNVLGMCFSFKILVFYLFVTLKKVCLNDRLLCLIASIRHNNLLFIIHDCQSFLHRIIYGNRGYAGIILSLAGNAYLGRDKYVSER
jgi:hypothetical protein